MLLSSGCTTSAATNVRAPTTAPSATATKPTDAEQVRVLRVVDGDTIVLGGIEVGEVDPGTGGRKARLIGIDTPEVYGGIECLGREASAFTRRELDGRSVVVTFDVDPVDRYGRALVYVWVDRSLFNERIVAEGFALPMTVPPNVKYADVFLRASRESRAHARGLWSRC